MFNTYEVNKASRVHVYDFEQFLKCKVTNEDTKEINQTEDSEKGAKNDMIKPILEFKTVLEKDEIEREVSKISWYVNNESFIASTLQG